MKAAILPGGLVCVVASLLCLSCGGASRATVHDRDVPKVFPWPTGKQEMTIRAKPQTTLANTCFLFGSFEEVVVNPETTFYITDELDKQFAYTPSRSPIRRLAPVKAIEIRWPVKSPQKPEAREAAPGEQEGSAEEKKEPAGAGSETAAPRQGE